MVTLVAHSLAWRCDASIFLLKDSPGIRRTDGRPQSLPSQLDDFAFLELLVHLRESISLTRVPRGRTGLFVPCKAEELPGWRTRWSCLLTPCSPALSVRALCSGGPQSLSKTPPGFTPHGCSSVLSGHLLSPDPRHSSEVHSLVLGCSGIADVFGQLLFSLKSV